MSKKRYNWVILTVLAVCSVIAIVFIWQSCEYCGLNTAAVQTVNTQTPAAGVLAAATVLNSQTPDMDQTPSLNVDPSTPEPTATISPASTPVATSAQTSQPAYAQPPLLSELLDQHGLSVENMEGTQLFVLAYNPGNTKLYLYDKDASGLWHLAYAFSANVGKNGVSDDKTEGDKTTPSGFYKIGFSFGNADKPDTDWIYRDVTDESYWVDDPDSAYYNTWVEGAQSKDWDSAEHLSDAKTAYAYALVIEYNMAPVVPNKGSAIFLHCGTGATSGCIAVPTSDMLTILSWLEPEGDPYILIETIESHPNN